MSLAPIDWAIIAGYFLLLLGVAGEVGSGIVADPARRSQIEVDIVVFAPAVPGEPRRILSLGEAKWGEALGARHLDRLRRARDLLADRGYDTRDTVLACYGRVDRDVRSGRDHVLAVGLDDLYTEADTTL